MYSSNVSPAPPPHTMIASRDVPDVVQVLHMLAADDTTTAGRGDATRRRTRFDLHVPNSFSVLVPALTACFNDSPWLASRLLATASRYKGYIGGDQERETSHGSNIQQP